MKTRTIWTQLKNEIDSDQVVVITGPRQVGKTTTINWLLEQIPSTNKIYFDMENIVTRELFESKDYDSILKELATQGLDINQKMYIAIDEIQLLENIPSVVKYLHDHYRIKFFLTGSSSYYIKNHFTQSMAGRKVLYEMGPLSFSEFLHFKDVEYQLPSKLDLNSKLSMTLYEKLKKYYQEYCDYGGLPNVVLTDSVERKQQMLEEIFSSYINLDVVTLADFKQTNSLRNVIKLVAARVGNKLNVSEIAKIAGITRVTVESYLEFLEQTYLIRLIDVYSSSTDVKTRLQKKPYFIDTGIANVNADLSAGSKFENTVCHQLSFYGELSYYSDSQGEIDFVLKTDEISCGFEVKVTPLQRDREALLKKTKKIDLDGARLIGQKPPASYTDFLWGGMIA